jgi:hypothetical protein
MVRRQRDWVLLLVGLLVAIILLGFTLGILLALVL